MTKPGPKKSQATIDREKKQAVVWTQKEARARERYIESPYKLSFRFIATTVGTSAEIVKQWAELGQWDLLRLHRQMKLSEAELSRRGMSLESVHISCLSLYVEAINASTRCVHRERNKLVPNFETMREAIATAAMAEEQVRNVYQWMPTVEQRMVIRELIDESRVRVRDMIKEYIDNNEPVFAPFRERNDSNGESDD